MLTTSRYNLVIPTENGDTILYNSAKGSVVKFSSNSGKDLLETLSKWPARIKRSEIDDKLAARLVELGYLRNDTTDSDELLEIRERYWTARGLTPLVLTITTTQDCNLGCYYCYESRSKDKLTMKDLSSVIELAKTQLSKGEYNSVHVDWYGGEPLLNVEFIEVCSFALQKLCLEKGINYHASVISNGTRWPNNAAEFAVRHKIRQVQVSFDGVGKSHSKIRHVRKGYENGATSDSFSLACDLVSDLLNVAQVDVRFNVSPLNVNEIDSFINLVNELGWLKKPFPCTLQPARVSMYSERSAFVRNQELSPDEFENVLARFKELSDEPKSVKTAWFENGVAPKNSVCAALARGSVVVGAEGLLYRCGLQVGEKSRAVGTLQNSGTEEVEQLTEFNDKEFWNDFDPTVLPNCSKCTFLPICWGGCPKKHLEGDSHSLHETSLYFRKHLPSRVAQESGDLPMNGYEFSEVDQFKGGVDRVTKPVILS